MKNLQSSSSTIESNASATASTPYGVTPPISLTTFSGSIPSPDYLEKYEKTLPGSASRILKLAEGEASHRREQQAKEINHRIDFELKQIAITMKNQEDSANLAHRGQLFAFILGLVGTIGGIYCAFIDQPLAASVIAGGGLATLISPFLKSMGK